MRQDLLLDENGDLKCVNGDFAVGDANQQNVQLILATSPGDWKASPTTGAGLIKTYQGNLTGFAKRNIKIQLEADGYNVISISENENGINVSTTGI
jgi:hypothetical protein